MAFAYVISSCKVALYLRLREMDLSIVGQQVKHQWTFDSKSVDLFCSMVQSCFVDNGEGETYPMDLITGQEPHVYGYADRSQLYYQCQVKIIFEEPGKEYERPKCNELRGFAYNGATTVDVRTGFRTLEIFKQRQTIPRRLSHGANEYGRQRLILSTAAKLSNNCVFHPPLPVFLGRCNYPPNCPYANLNS
uniref:ZP domain-containing protein n=1 Tax=Parascaris equorum TaxID=6256 RepID=A0A914RN90_PAREQ